MEVHMEGEKSAIIQTITRHINCLGEENRNTRKRALEGIKKETVAKKPALNDTVLDEVFREIVKPILKCFSDPIEKCRDLAITLTTDCLKKAADLDYYLPYVIPILVQRLGQQDITEPSEELRLSLVELLSFLVTASQKKIAPYLDDMIRMLQRTIIDPFPEVKKESCRCASTLAKTIPQYFHMQSESLVKPLVTTISHQHYRVRVEVVNAINNVLLYGNNKNVDDVVSHLAQRFFDNSPQVRIAVTQLVGTWLLDLPDRYSFFHKLIPLLLTSMTDELPEIRSQADALWHDVGLKYQSENENDLKDKQDFNKPDPEHYPKGVERPNMGCRELMYRNFSKILSGVVGDITDWVAPTRVKSAQLLYTMLLSEEDNCTQNLDKMLGGLYKGCTDEEKEVVKYVKKTSELIGYFVLPEVWVKMVLQNLKLSQNYPGLMVLASVIRGSSRGQLRPYLHDISSVLTEPGLCQIAEGKLQTELLSCVAALVEVCGADCELISLPLFTILVSVMALHRKESMMAECRYLFDSLASTLGMSSAQELFSRHTREVIGSLQNSYAQWTQHSVERLIFDALLVESGPVVGEILDDVIPMLVANLNPDKDAEVRLKFFTLLSRLMLNAPRTLDSQNRFGEFAVVVVRDMIIPNVVWRAGRTAAAIRKTAMSCLWALLESQVLNKDRLLEVIEDLVTQLRSCLEDDNNETRLVSCRVLTKIFTTAGPSLEQGRLHNMYPDLMKRLDDSSDDVRIAISRTWVAYFSCFGEDYEPGLYRAHLEDIYRGLLVHLDDPKTEIQEAILDVLKESAKLNPGLLMSEVENVRHKHRSESYCKQLSAHIMTLKIPE